MGFETDNQNLIGIFTTDTDLVVRVWDAALAEMTGIATDRACGRSILETIPNLEERGLLARFRRVLEEGTVELLAPAFHRFLIECPPRFASKHLTEMRQRVTVAPLREDETICGLLVTIEDVTARVERELELSEDLKSTDAAVRLRAAKAFARATDDIAEESAAPLIEALGDKNWRVRRELVEGLSHRAAPDAIAALLRAMRDRHFDFGVLNSALQVLQATSVETTGTLLDFLRGADADLRMQAALTLGEQRDMRALPGLLEALADENVNVRYHAVEALGKLKAQEAVEPLLKLAETRDFFLSFAALDALREIGDPTVAPRVLPLLSDDFLRPAVVEILAATGDPEIVAPLVDLLNADKSAAGAVAGALATLDERFAENAEVVKRMRGGLRPAGRANLLDAFELAGEQALLALIRLGGRLDDPQIREKLVALVEDEAVREAAARALAGQGAAGYEALAGLLDADDPKIRRTAIGALGWTGDGRAFEPLLELLENGDAAARQAAAGALKTLAHPETAGRLRALLDDPDPLIREVAVSVIGHFGAKDCEDALFERCRDGDERVRRAALEQVSKIDDERAVATLIRALREGSARERETAAKGLAQVTGDEAAAALREALGDADSWTRYFAIRALGTLGDTASLELLNEMAVKDPAEQVRAAAREVASQWQA